MTNATFIPGNVFEFEDSRDESIRVGIIQSDSDSFVRAKIVDLGGKVARIKKTSIVALFESDGFTEKQ